MNFKSDEFREFVDSIIRQETECLGLDYEKETILDFLQSLTTGDEENTETSVFIKTASLPVSKPIADEDVKPTMVSSVQKLVRTAIAKAMTEERNTLTKSDMFLSMIDNYCKVWPFCDGQ